MIVHPIKIVGFATVAACVAIVVYCAANGIHSMNDFRNYRAMRSVPDPIVVALADRSLTIGSTTQQMLAIDTPLWTEDYGRCKIHGFAPKLSYNHQTIVTVNDRIVSARVGSCTWHWAFFDEMPDSIAELVGSVDGLRYAIERMPEHADILQPLLDAQLASLDIQPVSSEGKAEPSDPRERRSVRCGHRQILGCRPVMPDVLRNIHDSSTKSEIGLHAPNPYRAPSVMASAGSPVDRTAAMGDRRRLTWAFATLLAISGGYYLLPSLALFVFWPGIFVWCGWLAVALGARLFDRPWFWITSLCWNIVSLALVLLILDQPAGLLHWHLFIHIVVASFLSYVAVFLSHDAVELKRKTQV